ncbi:uncharacterized protein LOC128638629 [Bombina bombina]|uniref:uncharacterized protein LOC128638629 n=1 Tax=Bombina bombina TaxID=8345 RepID=UPI00235A6C74|nr:uncharacterized protein LOC128638629 [Bombina bombina]
MESQLISMLHDLITSLDNHTSSLKQEIKDAFNISSSKMEGHEVRTEDRDSAISSVPNSGPLIYLTPMKYIFPLPSTKSEAACESLQEHTALLPTAHESGVMVLPERNQQNGEDGQLTGLKLHIATLGEPYWSLACNQSGPTGRMVAARAQGHPSMEEDPDFRSKVESVYAKFQKMAANYRHVANYREHSCLEWDTKRRMTILADKDLHVFLRTGVG